MHKGTQATSNKGRHSYVNGERRAEIWSKEWRGGKISKLPRPNLEMLLKIIVYTWNIPMSSKNNKNWTHFRGMYST